MTKRRPSDEPFLADHLDRWLSAGAKRWRPATYDMYESLVNVHVVPAFRRKRLSAIGPEDVRAWQRDMAGRGIGAVTRRRAQQVAAQALRALIDRGALSRNPFVAAPLPKAPVSGARVPTEAEVARLLRHCDDPQVRGIVLLALTALLRIGEILSLRRRDLNLDARTITVPVSVSRNPANKPLRRREPEPEPRELGIPPVTATALRKALARRQDEPEDAPLFSRGGVPFDRHNFRNRVWLPLLKAARISEAVRFDSLRHAGSGLLLQAGVPVHEVAERARLADPRMLVERHGDAATPRPDDAIVRATERLVRDVLDE